MGYAERPREVHCGANHLAPPGLVVGLAQRAHPPDSAPRERVLPAMPGH